MRVLSIKVILSSVVSSFNCFINLSLNLCLDFFNNALISYYRTIDILIALETILCSIVRIKLYIIHSLNLSLKSSYNLTNLFLSIIKLTYNIEELSLVSIQACFHIIIREVSLLPLLYLCDIVIVVCTNSINLVINLLLLCSIQIDNLLLLLRKSLSPKVVNLCVDTSNLVCNRIEVFYENFILILLNCCVQAIKFCLDNSKLLLVLLLSLWLVLVLSRNLIARSIDIFLSSCRTFCQLYRSLLCKIILQVSESLLCIRVFLNRILCELTLSKVTTFFCIRNEIIKFLNVSFPSIIICWLREHSLLVSVLDIKNIIQLCNLSLQSSNL